MSGSQLKISADTSEVKKSILDIGKSFKDLKGSKIAIFSEADKKFIKSEFKKEIALMKQKLKENREEIAKMVAEQQKLTEGSQAELEARKKILEAYKTQAKLAKQLGQAQKGVGDMNKSDGSLMGSIKNFMTMLPGLAAAAVIGYAVLKGKAANDQYVAGASNRNRLKGLGVSEDSFGSPEALARVGLTEQDMIQRRIDATSRLGRSGTSNEGELRKAGFERAFGLEGGTMTNIANSLRGTMGGAGANDAQMKLQASVLASGIEDAIAPYLESAVQLLQSINENGTTNTAEMTAMLAQLTKDGQRTPEMMAKTFETINGAVKGATGESSAFLQAAFARGGIGGGTIGGTKFSMASGGIMGLNQDELAKRGYNPELLKNMQQNGMFSGVGKRTGAILDMLKSSGGLKSGQNLSDITNTDQMVGIGNLASNTLGIKDPSQAFDAALMLEKVQNKQMSQKDFESKMKEMQEGADPTVKRLDQINNTLSGQTEILRSINTNLMETLGKEAVQAGNVVVSADNQGIKGVTNVAGAINGTGVTGAAQKGVNGVGGYITGGGLGSSIYDFSRGMDDNRKVQQMTSDDAIIALAKKKRDEGTGFKGMNDEQIEAKVKASLGKIPTAKEIGKEVANALKEAPIVNQSTTRINLPDGRVTNRTSK